MHMFSMKSTNSQGIHLFLVLSHLLILEGLAVSVELLGLGLEELLLGLLSLDNTELDLVLNLRDGVEGSIVDGLDVLLTLLNKNKAVLVSNKTLDVLLYDVILGVSTAVIDGNTKESSAGWIESGLKELLLSEATAKANLGVVANGGAVDNWAKWTLDWAWGDSLGTSSASVAAAKGTGWVIEVVLNALVPVLTEVVIRNPVVLANHG